MIQKALSADHDVTMAETNRRGHATRLAQGAANEGVDVVVCLGGDGTLNEAANGLAGTDTALAALPGGSTNVFARTIGLPNDPIEATAVLLDALAAGSIEPVGLGSVNGRYFLFHVGMGFDAAVVQQVERRAGAQALRRPPAVHVRDVLDLVPPLRPQPAAVRRALRGRHGGRRRLLRHLPEHEPVHVPRQPAARPRARSDARPGPGDGDASARSRCRRCSGRRRRALGVGRDLRQQRRVDLRTDVDELTVHGHGPFPYQVDGDYLGEIEHLEFRHEPDVLRLVR